MTVEPAAKRYKRTGTIYVIGDVAFVANPTTRSAWWKTHASVAFAACPTCKAAVGVRCAPSFGFDQGRTHETRKRRLPKGANTVAKFIVQQSSQKEGSP
jgi:hypothetical protein